MKKNRFTSNINLSFQFLLLIGVTMLNSCVQEKPAGEQVINSYESMDGVISLKIPPGLIGLFLSGEKNEEAREVFGKMKSIKLIVVDVGKIEEKSAKDFTHNFIAKIKESGFSDWLRVTDNGEQIGIFALEEEKKIKEMMVLITGDDGFMGLNVVGPIDPDQLVKVVKKLNPGDFNIN